MNSKVNTMFEMYVDMSLGERARFLTKVFGGYCWENVSTYKVTEPIATTSGYVIEEGAYFEGLHVTDDAPDSLTEYTCRIRPVGKPSKWFTFHSSHGEYERVKSQTLKVYIGDEIGRDYTKK